MATTPYPFVAATVLTALQLNSTFNIPTTTLTASHTLTAADAGTRVYMNSASATTITVDTSIFSASDVVEIVNLGAGVCTITAGTCTVSTTGTLALVQNAGGKLTFISAGVSVFQADGVAATASGLTFLSGGTVTATTSANFDSVFSATYDNYRVIISNIVTSGSAISAYLKLRVGGVTNSDADYTYQSFRVYGGPTTDAISGVNGTAGLYLLSAGTTLANEGGACIMDFTSPFLANPTTVLSSSHSYYTAVNSYFMSSSGGTHAVSSSFDGFNISTVTTTLAYKYKIYGYANS